MSDPIPTLVGGVQYINVPEGSIPTLEGNVQLDTLPGYAEASGETPQEPASPTLQTVGHYIYFQYPNRNNELDPDGEPQPMVPPMEIEYVEMRYTFNDLALTNPFDKSINWTYHTRVAPLGPSAQLQDPNQPFGADLTKVSHNDNGPANPPVGASTFNDYIGLFGSMIVRPIHFKDKYYFQMRCVSRSGVPSDWTPVIRLTSNPEPDASQQPQTKIPCTEDSAIFL
jgi:hypothetical protein